MDGANVLLLEDASVTKWNKIFCYFSHNKNSNRIPTYQESRYAFFSVAIRRKKNTIIHFLGQFFLFKQHNYTYFFPLLRREKAYYAKDENFVKKDGKYFRKEFIVGLGETRLVQMIK